MKKMISVIIPVYNSEKYLEKCLSSICNQTYKNLDIIVVDDGSIDKSPEICDKFKVEDTRVRVVHQENHGVSYSRNIGINMANGDYIGFVDSDDFIENDMYEFLLDNLIKHNANISICGSSNVYDNGKIINTMKKDIKLELNNNDALKYVFKNGYFGTGMCNKLFEKKLLKSVCFNDSLSYGEELNVLVETIINSKKVYYDSSSKYYYYQRQDSATHTRKVNVGMMNNFKSVLLANKGYFEKNMCVKKAVISHYILACLQVYNRSILYFDKDKNYKIAKTGAVHNKKYIDYSTYSTKKGIQVFLFINFNFIYYLIVKSYAIVRRGLNWKI